MASSKEIKRRIRGVNSILQITKAMELVSQAKLRKAKANLEATRPYYDTVLEDIKRILPLVHDDHPLLQERESKNVLYIVVSSDRGLAGGYNSNIVKLTESSIAKAGANASLVVVGSKARDYFKRRNYDIKKFRGGINEVPSYNDAKELARVAMEMYKSGEVDAIDLIYTRFVSTISYEPQMIRLLPSEDIQKKDGNHETQTLVEFEPSPEMVLNFLIPQYIESTIYGALIEASASEQAARRTSMEAASDNAEDIIDELQTNYNRARQSAITSEIIEISSAAEALN